jgi:hypothetical protein
MTLADVDRLFAYWKDHPSVVMLLHVMARCLGWKPKPVDFAIIDGVSYEEKAKPTQAMFADPARFFKKIPVARGAVSAFAPLTG